MADPGASGGSSVFQPMGFRDYLAVLNRRRGVIVLVTLIVFGIGLYLSLNETSQYKASGEVLLRVEGAEAGTVPTEARILESPAVHELALEKDPNAGEVNATDDPSVNVITVTAEDTDADQAAATVNAHMNAYVDYSRQAELDRYLTALKVIQPTIDDLQRQIDFLGNPTQLNQENALRRSDLLSQQLGLRAKLQDIQVNATLAGDNTIVVADAAPPGSPFRPKPVRDALIALGAGLLLAIALAFVVELLDDSIRTSEDLERTIGSLPLLAMIPPMHVPRSGLVTVVAPRSTPAEAYRALRTAVQFLVMERGSCIEIASARAGEGKSVTTANLAVALAQAGQRVIVVEADLRAPTMHTLFGVSNEVGLTSVVMGEPLSNALQPVPNVENLRGADGRPDPRTLRELIASDRCRQVIQCMCAPKRAIILIDTPPILAVTDAMVVAGFVDAVLLIREQGRARAARCADSVPAHAPARRTHGRRDPQRRARARVARRTTVRVTRRRRRAEPARTTPEGGAHAVPQGWRRCPTLRRASSTLAGAVVVERPVGGQPPSAALMAASVARPVVAEPAPGEAVLVQDHRAGRSPGGGVERGGHAPTARTARRGSRCCRARASPTRGPSGRPERSARPTPGTDAGVRRAPLDAGTEDAVGHRDVHAASSRPPRKSLEQVVGRRRRAVPRRFVHNVVVGVGERAGRRRVDDHRPGRREDRCDLACTRDLGARRGFARVLPGYEAVHIEPPL